jgi:hypothetical protein
VGGDVTRFSADFIPEALFHGQLMLQQRCLHSITEHAAEIFLF